MTYITTRVPKLADLKKELEEHPNRIELYCKYMGYDGDSEAIAYLEEKIKEYMDSKNVKK
jgi:hypothetical protein